MLRTLKIQRPSRRVALALALLLVALGGLLPTVASAAQRQRCFPQTGRCVSGPILDYWERNGGLAVFGYPISGLATETVEGTWAGPVQWFERDRLEDHSNEGISVLAGRLGAALLENQGRPFERGNDGPMPGRALCRLFPETGYNVCGELRFYWENNGGLLRFGYPLTQARQEIIEGKPYLVQYFERRRLEYHPENQPPYNVLLGLLGRDLRGSNGQTICLSDAGPELQPIIVATRDRTRCPSYGRAGLQTVWQGFERGDMFWVPGENGKAGTIYVRWPDYASGMLRWAQYPDTYVEGEPVGTAELPPPGLFSPVRGFGKLWRNNAEVRALLGWGAGPEQAETATELVYARHNAHILHRSSVGVVEIMFPGGEASQAALRP